MALCLAAYIPACLDYCIRLLGGKADVHHLGASLQRKGLLNTTAGFHGNKGVGSREMSKSK